METRLATLADAPHLVALHQASFGDAAWDLAQLTDSLSLPTSQTWLVGQGAPQGFILCQIVADEAEILTFCVKPNLRRQGIGRLLLEQAIQAARQQKARRLFLEVAADNLTAIALYQKNGFQPNGIRHGYYNHGGRKIDALMLSRDL